MSSILTRGGEEKRTGLTSDGSGSLTDAFEIVLEEVESGRSVKSGGGSTVRPFLVVDLGAAFRYVRGDRGGATETIENVAAETLRTEMRESGRDRGGTEGKSGDGGGSGMLSKLFFVGVAVGLGYVLSRRSGSVGQAVDRVTDRAGSAADETELRSGEMAGRTEAVADEAADRIQESGETVADEAADRVRESGEQAADQIQEAGETAANLEEEAAESAEEMIDEGEENDESS